MHTHACHAIKISLQAMAAQGIHFGEVHDELMRSTSPSLLFDLAGNSFNSFVCGAVTFSALRVLAAAHAANAVVVRSLSHTTDCPNDDEDDDFDLLDLFWEVPSSR